MKNDYKIVIRKPEEKRHLGFPGVDVSIKMTFLKRECEIVGWIYFAVDCQPKA
jgi:hypothetical protein